MWLISKRDNGACKTRPRCVSLGSDFVISCPPEYDTVALRLLGECKVHGIRMSCNNEC